MKVLHVVSFIGDSENYIDITEIDNIAIILS